jgi:hypothetical protein
MARSTFPDYKPDTVATIVYKPSLRALYRRLTLRGVKASLANGNGARRGASGI